MARGNKKCDGCGALFEPCAGLLILDDYYITTDKKGTSNSYSGDDGEEFDFCLACSTAILKAMGAAALDPDAQGEQPK